MAHRVRAGCRFAEAVDRRTGTIRAEADLTVPGADVIRGAAEQLHRGGHVHVTADLRGIRVADDALEVLRALASGLRADAGELVVLPAPATAPGSEQREEEWS